MVAWGESANPRTGRQSRSRSPEGGPWLDLAAILGTKPQITR